MPRRCDFDHNYAGTAFVQGDSASGSKTIEQTLSSHNCTASGAVLISSSAANDYAKDGGPEVV